MMIILIIFIIFFYVWLFWYKKLIFVINILSDIINGINDEFGIWILLRGLVGVIFLFFVIFLI